MSSPLLSSLLLVGLVSGCGSGDDDGGAPRSHDFSMPGASTDLAMPELPDLAVGDGPVDLLPSKADMYCYPRPSLSLTDDDGGVPDGGLLQCGPAPTVKITSPALKMVVSGSTLYVTAVATTVSPTEKYLDSVVLSIIPPVTDPPTIVPAPAKMGLTIAANTFEGQLDMRTIPSGPVTVVVTATDLGGNIGQASLQVIYDAGPTINVYLPAPSDSYRGSSAILFSVTDFFGVDTTAGVTTANVQQAPIPITLVPNSSPPAWQGTIDFHSNLFPQALVGAQILRITARNINKTVATLDSPFIVDETGPTYIFNTPTGGQFVSGVIDIDIQVDDPAGVADQTVTALFGDDPKYQVMLSRASVTTMSSDHFIGTFDVNQLPAAYVLPILSVRASDTLGNQSEQGEELIVDVVPPAIDLDPSDHVHYVDAMTHVCSHAIDPVGIDAPDDGDLVHQLMSLRARIEDQGNVGTGQSEVFVSQIDDSSVSLWVIKASSASGPLVVDTDGDGVCDDINPLLVPSPVITQPNQAIVIPFSAIPIGGIPDLSGPDATRTDEPFPGEKFYFGCPIGNGALVPTPVCVYPQYGHYPIINMSYLVSDAPAIYSIPPFTPSDLLCEGLQFDSANSVPDGPLCIAVRARDRAGNRNVSKPLHVCLDKTGNNLASCDTTLYKGHQTKFADPAIFECTGVYDKVTNTANGNDHKTTCRPGVKDNVGAIRDAYPVDEALHPI